MSHAVHYTIRPAHPAAHLFEVTCTVSDPDPGGQRFSLPVWIPGSYLIRDFARHIVRLSARGGGLPLAVTKVDKATWVCAPCDGPVSVDYEVYAWDLSVRGAHLDTTHAYFNGPAVFVQAEGRAERECVVDIEPPAGETYANWRVATAMPRAGAPAYGFGRYRAADYDELIDHPVEMGCFDLFTFEAGGVPHDVAITGRHNADTARLARDLKRVCEQHLGLFGGTAPMSRYTFLITAVGEGYGGLEHRASTSLLVARSNLVERDPVSAGEDYRTFLGLASHEYFHTWNVKRIKPAAFTPYDLARENYTRQLWAFEGITSYYDDLALLRARLIDTPSYLELLGQTLTRVLRGSGRLKQSVAESSFDAWTKFYRQDENSPNAIVSYYAKGALIALALDLTLRLETQGQASLDDVMRALWSRYGLTGQGVPEEGVERVAEEIAKRDLRAFFGQAVHGTGDLPLDALLASFGVRMHLRPADSESDKGGRAAKDEQALARRATLGARLAEGEVRLAQVLDGGAAQAAGLAAGDLIVAIDGLRVTRAGFQKRLHELAPGDRVRIHAFRRDELMVFDVVLASAPVDTAVLTLDEAADEVARKRRQAWLGS